MFKSLVTEILGVAVPADQTAATTNILDVFRWKHRVALIFSDGNNEKATRQENALLADRDPLARRDLVVLRLRGDDVTSLFGPDLDHDADSIRERMDIVDGEFGLVLIGKDGGIKLRRREPVSAEEIFLLIDSMPMRRSEAEDEADPPGDVTAPSRPG